MSGLRKWTSVLWLLIYSSFVLAQNNGRNLTSVLTELAVERNVIISFSPTFTDKIPFVPVPLSGTVDLILERLLKGTPFTYKRINSSRYFIYKKKKLPAPEVVSLRPEKKAVPLLLPPPAEKKLLPLPEKNVLLVTPAPL